MSGVLITGANGFAGSHLLEHLAARGLVGGGLQASEQKVTAWSRSAPRPELADLADWRQVDLLDGNRVREAVEDLRPVAVYHCAGSPHVGRSWSDTAEPLANNVLATHHLLDALWRANLRCRVLIPGSAMVYAPSTQPIPEDHDLAPGSPYALSKLAQEQLGLIAARDDGIDVIVTRSFNHTGPRQSAAFAAPAFARQIALIECGALPPVLKVGNLDAQRDLTDVRDTVRAYVLLMERGTAGTVYNVATGTARSIRSVLDALLQRARVAIRVEIDPVQLRPSDAPVLVGNPARLIAATGWGPVISFDRMLDDLLEYWRKETRGAKPSASRGQI